MATAIPLPQYRALPELVIFHREHPADEVLLMQVPTNEARTEFETYLVRLDQGEHKAWIDRLPQAKNLLDMLGYAMHVAYCPSTGFFKEMEDVDMPTPTAMAVGYARAMVQPLARQDAFDRRRRLERAAPMPISSLRQRLGGPEQRLYGREGYLR